VSFITGLVCLQLLAFYFFQKAHFQQQAELLSRVLGRSREYSAIEDFADLKFQALFILSLFVYSLVLLNSKRTMPVKSVIEKYTVNYSVFVVIILAEMFSRFEPKHEGYTWYILYIVITYIIVNYIRNTCVQSTNH